MVVPSAGVCAEGVHHGQGAVCLAIYRHQFVLCVWYFCRRGQFSYTVTISTFAMVQPSCPWALLVGGRLALVVVDHVESPRLMCPVV